MITLSTLNLSTKLMASSKKKDFPNHYKRIAAVPADMFKSIEWEEFYDWRVCSWELDDDYIAVIRNENKRTGKVKEYVYKRADAMVNKLHKLMEDDDNIITIADHDEIHHLYFNDAE